MGMRPALALGLWLAAAVVGAQAADPPEAQPESVRERRLACLEATLRTTPADTSVETLRKLCGLEKDSQRARNEQALRTRLALEEAVRYNPFVLTPHRRNYFLFWSYWSNPEWNDASRDDKALDQNETKFQLSFKTPVVEEFWGDTTLYAAFTMVAFWQLYNGDMSRPFRETNYQPELFVSRAVRTRFGPIQSELLSFGYAHQSNGRDVPGSRSWERLFLNYVFTTGSWYWAFKPWWRIPEDERSDPLDPRGDDNPDIERYMGHFELTLARPFGNHVTELMFRNTLRENNRGAAQIDYSFPLTRRFKGLLQVFTGYGDSLINYDDYETRVSVGVLLTDDF